MEKTRDEKNLQLFKSLRNCHKDTTNYNKLRNTIILQNQPFVTCVVKKFYKNYGHLRDDIFSVGEIGLIKAVDTFDIDKDLRFSQYASACIENEVKYLIKRENRQKNIFKFCEIRISEIDKVQCHEDAYEKVINSVDLKESLKSLTERELTVIKCYDYTDEALSQKEIGQMLHVSQSFASRVRRQALAKLRNAFGISIIKAEENE